MKDPMQKLAELLADTRDTNEALRRAACGGTVGQCACGCFTLNGQCPKCAREAEAAAKNGQREGTTWDKKAR